MDASVSDLDAQIVDMECKLLELKSRRNALVPICRMPPEIIVWIIKTIQGRQEDDKDAKTFSARALDTEWRQFTLACSYIRRVAINNPEVWACIDGSWMKKWIEASVEHSKEAPLTIRSVCDSEGRNNRSVVLRLLPRAMAASFQLSNYRENIRTQIALNDRPLPHLRFLKYASSWISMKQTFLGGAIQQLQSLDLQSVRIEGIPEGDFSSLRYLRLARFETYTKHDIQALMQFLANAVNLEDINIGLSGVFTEPARSVPLDKIALPNLRSLQLSGGLVPLWILLQSLPDPKLTLSITIAAHVSQPFEHRCHWKPNATGRHSDIISRITTFWKIRTGEEHLPEGTLTVLANNDNRPDVVALSFITHEPRPDHINLSYISPCIIDDDDPLLAGVHTLFLSGRNHGATLADTHPAGVRFLPELRHIIIYGALTAVDLEGFEDWVRQRNELKPNQPLESVTFRACRDQVQAVADRIEEIVPTGCVTWVS
jgi:hypothetical protein